MHPAALPLEKLLADCAFSTSRRSGPGGQHRNKVETAVIVTHQPTDIVAEASERRSQQANRQTAIHRLRLKLAIAVRSPASQIFATREPKIAETAETSETIEGGLFAISDLWKRRVAGGRVAIAVEHSDYPAMLAELLDHLAMDYWDVAPVAGRIQLTGSQLTKFLRKYPAALCYVNEQRKLHGLSILR